MPEIDETTSGTAAVADPLTLNRYAVGAPPDAAGSQDTLTVRPTLDATKCVGGSGGLVHPWGNVTVTGLEEPLAPEPFTARRDSVKVPGVTPAKARLFVRPNGSPALSVPPTSRRSDVGAPPG